MATPWERKCIDAFCTISMGKEKFVTATREKTRAPDWQEQCDMPISEDAVVKITVYHQHKTALSKGDFIGRTYITLRDLQDYERVHKNWYTLMNKDGKADKDRGEIEVSLQFYAKNGTTGSVLDLSTKRKHLSFGEIKRSLRNKAKIVKPDKKSKYNGENQLADQRRRLGGDASQSVRDFLDDSASEGTASFAGSMMSLNSMSFDDRPKKCVCYDTNAAEKYFLKSDLFLSGDVIQCILILD
ncbi:unnamed protein product [Didymodactylos carnosus]|uniref:C2 domain-containing protein n=1 Tax=Didymodactylos carnosus TaxID=1234261 RepID=A0A813WUU1_9BILA|nr:unnamed protein product [Didymodactylos carnosus]CAF3648476.1 unnamed protein product [Didymodactylos carnosus]